MFKKTILICRLVLFCFGVNAQTCKFSIEGTLRDNDNNEPLGFAFIQLLQPAKNLQCDENGHFVIRDLCPGHYQLLIQHIGCRDSVFNILLSHSVKINLKLPHSLNALNDVEVITKHEEVKFTQSEQTLDSKALDKSRGQNLGDQLKQLNGVTTFNTGPSVSKPMINGMQGYRILILNNGVRQENQNWGTDHAPEIDPFIAQKLSVVRGASSVRYGSDALGGVILVEPADLPDTASITGEFNTVAYSNGRGTANALQVQGYFDKLKYFNWRVQGTLKKAGALKTPEYYLKNTGLEEANFSYALGYHRKKFGFSLYYSQFNSKLGIFTGSQVGNLTDLQAAFNQNKPQDSLAPFSYAIGRPYQNIEHELIKLSADLHTGQRSRIYLNYAWQYNIRSEYDKHTSRNDSLAALNLPEAHYQLNTQLAELIWEHDYVKSFRGKFGVQGMMQENRYEGRFFIPNYNTQSLGAFALERYVLPKFEFESGIRYDYKHLQSFYFIGKELQEPIRNFDNVSFNLGSIYKPDSRLKINLNLSSAWRAPSVNELYSNGLHHGVGAIERGDKELKPERCLSAISTFQYTSKKWYTEISAYTYRFQNYIYYVPSQNPELTLRGAFPVYNFTQNNTIISGSDLLIRYTINRSIQVSAKSMWVRGFNTDLNEYLIYMPADRYQLYFTFNFKDLNKIKDLYIEPNVLYVCKQFRTPSGSDFAPPPGAYALFGLNAGSTLFIGKQTFIFTFSISNAANSIYRDYLDRYRYYADAPGANYTLRLRIPFTLYDKK